jgi:hypothetical protein
MIGHEGRLRRARQRARAGTREETACGKAGHKPPPRKWNWHDDSRTASLDPHAINTGAIRAGNKAWRGRFQCGRRADAETLC